MPTTRTRIEHWGEKFVASSNRRGGNHARRTNRKRTKGKTGKRIAAGDASKALIDGRDDARQGAFQDEWAASRHGATAARGFHFQDAVGAWIAARVADGSQDGVLVPEGLDDMSIEGSPDCHVQVKSRVARRGPFDPKSAAQHILDAWLANESRSAPAAFVSVVLENGISSSESFASSDAMLRDILEPGSPLDLALRTEASGRVTEVALTNLLARTNVMALTWTELNDRTDEHLANVTTVDPAGRGIALRALRLDVADATDNNANPDSRARAVLDRTLILKNINATAEQIDVESLNAALRRGLCIPLDWSVGLTTGDRFYEGVASQPGHVASGLVVPRVDLLDEITREAKPGRPIVITGPSGVGKSALLWTVPTALPGVTWFRVEHLVNQLDANDVIRLARAYGASSSHPVGFLLDGAGPGRLAGWHLLQELAATHEGILLFASTRSEDLATLGDLSETTTLAVDLDHAGAEAIFRGLKRRGVTTAEHWREAFEESRGLTLEFTFILTQGRRLQDVINDQIQRRLLEHRDAELDLLALVSVADRWSAAVPVEQLSGPLHDTPADIRRSLSRLADEHLIVEADGVLSGTHPVRSTAISDAIHDTPPPTLRSTVERLLAMVSATDLPTFVLGCVREHPSFLGTMIDAALAQSEEPRRVAAILHGLRLADSEAAISDWVAILHDEPIVRSIQPTVVMLALAGLDMGDLTPQPIRDALDRIADVPARGMRNELADAIGPASLSQLISDSDPAAATEVVATLQGWPGLAGLTAPDIDGRLVAELQDAPLAVLSDVLGACRATDPALWQGLVDRLGGEARMLEIVRNQHPWVLTAELRSDADGPVAFGRILHVDDEAQGDPRERCVALARVLLRLLPSVERTDVQALLAGGVTMEIGGHNMATSGLVREYDRHDTEIAWNQARTSIAQVMIGVPDAVRLAAAFPILRDLAPLVREVGNRWVRSDATAKRNADLSATLAQLDLAARELPPPLGAAPADLGSVTAVTTASLNDSLSNAFSDVTGVLPRLTAVDSYASLGMHIQDQVVPHLRRCADEPWDLIERGEEARELLDQLIGDVVAIHDVVKALAAGEINAREIEREARRASVRYALQRCAAAARERHALALEQKRANVAATVLDAVPERESSVFVEEREGFECYAVLVDSPPLFEWGDIETRVVAALQPLSEGMKRFLILPIRRGKRIPQTGVHLLRSPLPALDVEAWEHMLPESHAIELATLITKATSSLSTLSGLADLNEWQFQHPEVRAVAQRARVGFEGSFETLKQRESNQLTELALPLLADLAARVERELEHSDSQAGTLASALVAGMTGTPTEEFNILSGLRVSAIEWEIEPESVLPFLKTVD